MPEASWSGKHRALRSALCGAVWWTGAAAASADCAPEPQGEGRIASALDARTLRLDDGRIIRLAGLAPLQGDDAQRANAIITGLAVGRRASLHGESDAPDRYGRQVAWVFAEGDAVSLQEKLTAAGGGLRDLSSMPSGCREGLESAENTARAGRLGLWATSKFAKSAESPDDILPKIGHFMVLEGRVRSVRQTRGTTYLNFGRRWREGFAVTVPARAVAVFEAAGMRLQGFEGRRIRVRGYVMQRGGPRIEVLSPDQIAGADETATTTGKQD